MNESARLESLRRYRILDTDPDVIISGSLLTLARMAGPDGASPDGAAIRDGALDISGDAYTAQRFQQLLHYAKPDIEDTTALVIAPKGRLVEQLTGRSVQRISKKNCHR